MRGSSPAAVLGTAMMPIVLLVLLGCQGQLEAEAPPAEPQVSEADLHPQQVARGEYLVRVGSCNDCHTPWIFDEQIGAPRPDMSRMLSGHPADGPDPEGTVGPHDAGLIGPTFTSFALPFGITYAANLTPDVDTGTGSWTEQMFVDIFRKGRHLGGDGRGIMPPMPWLWIRNLTDDDLRAVFAYLQSIPPVRNAVPEHKVPEEVIWALRDSDEKVAAVLPHAEWATVQSAPRVAEAATASQ